MLEKQLALTPPLKRKDVQNGGEGREEEKEKEQKEEQEERKEEHRDSRARRVICTFKLKQKDKGNERGNDLKYNS